MRLGTRHEHKERCCTPATRSRAASRSRVRPRAVRGGGAAVAPHLARLWWHCRRLHGQARQGCGVQHRRRRLSGASLRRGRRVGRGCRPGAGRRGRRVGCGCRPGIGFGRQHWVEWGGRRCRSLLRCLVNLVGLAHGSVAVEYLRFQASGEGVRGNKTKAALAAARVRAAAGLPQSPSLARPRKTACDPSARQKTRTAHGLPQGGAKSKLLRSPTGCGSLSGGLFSQVRCLHKQEAQGPKPGTPPPADPGRFAHAALHHCKTCGVNLPTPRPPIHPWRSQEAVA